MKLIGRIGLVAVLFAMGAAVLSPGGTFSPSPVSAAYDCSILEPLRIEIRTATNALVNDSGFSVQVTGPAFIADESVTRTVFDNGVQDDESDLGIIHVDGCVPVDGTEGLYAVGFADAPIGYSDCLLGSQRSGEAGGPAIVLVVDCSDAGLLAARIQAIAVTADPNVIPCGGTAVLTATARDAAGHIIEGVEFHWATDVGQLNVGPPNTAHATAGVATLTLSPGMTTTKVTAWVGGTTTAPGFVTVQQFCPGVDEGNHESRAPGAITLSASSNTATCGETVFIGARVRDSKNQVVADATLVSFIASGGEFQTGAGVVTDYSAGGDEASAASTLNTVSQYTAETKAGVLNLVWIAPLYNGDISITAAAGDKFSKLIISVKCAHAPATTVSGGGGGSAPPACTPIGDGICITAPSTGARITPPSTGDAGLN